MNKIVNNVTIIVNNLIVKFVEDDIVLSLNIKSAELYSWLGQEFHNIELYRVQLVSQTLEAAYLSGRHLIAHKTSQTLLC
jgi:hypothetical protein